MRSKLKKFLLVVGARPNFMKLAPLYFELKKKKNLKLVTVHTGQHYDYTMSQSFFEDLRLPQPDYFLGIKARTQISQIGKILSSFEEVLHREKPGLVVVFGDVNSTFACAFAAQRLQIPVAHVESGLRSFDETMPEEINRRLTDCISELLFTTTKDDDRQLLKENILKNRIHWVGDIMIDSLLHVLKKMTPRREDQLLSRLGLYPQQYGVVTLHRPSNVDQSEQIKGVMASLKIISQKIQLIFPMHPRTRKNLGKFGIDSGSSQSLRICQPFTYSEFVILEKNARLVITDSGGIQIETAVLKVPCLTLRPNTERPLTIRIGTNRLVDLNNLHREVNGVLRRKRPAAILPPRWDGKTAQRIGRILEKWAQK